MSHIFLINISGDDKPGEFSSLMSVLADYEAAVLDVNQVIIHRNLALGFLVEIPGDNDAQALIKDLLFKAHEINLSLKYQLVTVDEYRQWVSRQGKERYIITVLGRRLLAEQLQKISRVIVDQGLNIDVINRLTGRPSLEKDTLSDRACIEISVRGTPKDAALLKTQFMEIAHELATDVAFQKDDIFRRHRRLVAFDMDSTLIQAEVIDELAKVAGKGEEVSHITEAAMRGELDFKTSLRKRLQCLSGLRVESLEKVALSLKLTEGTERLMATLKAVGLKTAILSGGFTYFGNYLQKKLGFDYVHSNELEIKDGKLTGNVIGEIVDGARKALLLKELAVKENILMEQVIAVGDGANDLPMLTAAGLGIAFQAKPIVRQGAKHAISNLGLDGILYLMGMRDRDIG